MEKLGDDYDPEEEEECPLEDVEECWDITRDAVLERRTSRSLATTLPPTESAGAPAEGGAPVAGSSKGRAGDGP